MLHASTRKLIDRLSEMTELGKLDWTESEDGNIAYATEGYSVTLTESPNEVIITSKDGKELERANADELAASQLEDGTAYSEIVAAMTSEASRLARGTEAAISSLLADMEDTPEADIAKPDAEPVEDLHEDPVNETTAMETAAETIEEAPTPEPESQIETDDQPDASASEVRSTEITSEGDDAERNVVAAPVLNTAQTDNVSDDDSHDLTEASSDAADGITSAPETLSSADEVTDGEPNSETESDVTEAVARLADEVNQREDSGLGAAAASAVGAVALAAGLTTQTSSEQDDSAPTLEEPDGSPNETLEAQPAEAPVYIPFGLEPGTDTAGENQVATVAETDDVSEQIETPSQVLNLDPVVPAAPEPEAPTETVPDFSISAEPEPSADPITELDASMTAPLSLTSAPFSTDAVEESTLEATEIAAETPEEVVAAAPSEDTDDSPTGFEQPVQEPDVTEAQPPKSYSLSGIGAGFGLGALSAKTEVSGIPSANPSGSTPPEKVIIDATDDVLPELEGNLNVSLAETASAAVSAANAEAAAPEKDAEAKDAESDILKPRTRFNPWD